MSDSYSTEFIVDTSKAVGYILDHLGNIHHVNLKDGTAISTVKLFESFLYPFSNSDISQEGRYIATGFTDDRLRIYEMEKGSFSYVSKPQKGKIISLALDRKDPILYLSLHSGGVAIFDVEKQKLIDHTNGSGSPFVTQSLTTHPNGEIVLFANHDAITLYNFKTRQVFKKLTRKVNRIFNMAHDPNGRYLAVATDKVQLKIWDLRLNKVVDSIRAFFPCVFTSDGQSIIAMSSAIGLAQYDIETGKQTATFNTDYELIQSVAVSEDGRYLAGAGYHNVLKVWDIETRKRVAVLTGHTGGILSIDFHPTKPWLVSGSLDGTSRIWDYQKKKEFQQFTDQTISIKDVAFRLNGRLLPFEQFDLHLNRPDIVAERIGKSSAQLIRAYYYLYKKRLKKLNLEEGDLRLDYKLPNLKLESKPDIVTTEKMVKFGIKAWDDNYNLKQINVYVNNVPIYGETGHLIEGNIKSYHKEISIPLINGKNKILISVLNSNGVESLYESIEIVRDGEPEKHDLYMVSIGVSDYQDERFALKYPTKDAEDMLNKFQESETRYRNVYQKKLLNNEVTLENIAALETFFANCTHEDLAIIFIAGHGVLDQDYNYYFGTWDMDFNQPAERGLTYTQLSSLLNKIKAYQKLLIMDTCHSGELDKDEIEEGPPAELEEGDVQFRAAGVGVRKKDGLGFDNSIKFTQDLFSDLRKGSGATVISSAGGAEFAMESDEWNNGLFTYVFISGLNDENDDQKVYLSEIREYVNQGVQALSKGKQIPTAREENISRDYIIFGK